MTDLHRIQRGIRKELYEKDVQLGLGASGPVIAMAEDVVRTSTAAVESRATFDVVADADGTVVSVAVADSSEDRNGWELVAKELLTSLNTTRLRVPHGARGVAMTVAVESRETLPSGASPGANVTVFDKTLARGKTSRSAGVFFFPIARIPLLAVDRGDAGVDLLSIPIPLPVIAGVFDLTDIGATPTRVVHAHVSREEPL